MCVCVCGLFIAVDVFVGYFIIFHCIIIIPESEREKDFYQANASRQAINHLLESENIYCPSNICGRQKIWQVEGIVDFVFPVNPIIIIT